MRTNSRISNLGESRTELEGLAEALDSGEGDESNTRIFEKTSVIEAGILQPEQVLEESKEDITLEAARQFYKHARDLP